MTLTRLLWFTPVFALFALGMVFLAVGIDRLSYPYNDPDALAYVGAWAAVAVLGSALIGALMPRRKN